MTTVEWGARSATNAEGDVRAPYAATYALVAVTAIVHVCIAPLRRLTFDEAYYAAGAVRVPWTIPQHPPMLGILLHATSPLHALPVELRVRLVAVVLSAITALGIARLAATIATPASRERAALIAAGLASWGLLPMVSGIQTVPEDALLASLAWLAVVATNLAMKRAEHREIAVASLALLSACALASKASALPCLAAVSVALLRRGERSAAIAIVLGAAAALPSCATSLVGQSAHVLGQGPWVSESHTGALASLALITTSIVVVFGPAAIAFGARFRALRSIPGGAGVVVIIAAAIVASAAVSGRAPEVHWFAPACVPLYAAAAAGLSEAPRLARTVLATHVAPTIAGVVLWCVPIAAIDRHTDFFAEAPHVAFATNERPLAWTDEASRARTIPAYGMDAWQCVYAQRCEVKP